MGSDPLRAAWFELASLMGHTAAALAHNSGLKNSFAPLKNVPQNAIADISGRCGDDDHGKFPFMALTGTELKRAAKPDKFLSDPGPGCHWK